MKKSTLLIVSGIACTFALNANALNVIQYVSVKGAITKMQNDGKMDASYYGVSSHVSQNIHLENKFADVVNGSKIAYGLLMPIKHGDLRAELEFAYNGEADDIGFNSFHFDIPSLHIHNVKADAVYKMNTSVYSTMLNLFYDLNTGTAVTPYIGGGIGYARIDTKTSSSINGHIYVLPFSFTQDVNVHDNNFAWNASAGILYKISDKLSFDIGYRYTDYGTINYANSFQLMKTMNPYIVNASSRVTSSEAYLGIRYCF